MQGEEHMDKESRQNLPSYLGFQKDIFLVRFMKFRHRNTKPFRKKKQSYTVTSVVLHDSIHCAGHISRLTEILIK